VIDATKQQVEGPVGAVRHRLIRWSQVRSLPGTLLPGTLPGALIRDYVLIHTFAIMLVARRLLLEDAAGKAGLLR